MVDLEQLPLGDEAPEVVNAVIEVPLGSRGKYEFDPQLGVMVRDRVLPGSVRYPIDYGFVPSTVAVDDDALDVLVLAYDGAQSGSVLRVVPVGVLDIVDASGNDQKLLAVPSDDPRFEDIRALEDVNRASLDEIEQFFGVFKSLEGDEDVDIRGWLDRAAAHRLVEETRR